MWESHGVLMDFLPLVALVGLFVAEILYKKRKKNRKFPTNEKLLPEEREKEQDEYSRRRSEEIKALRKKALRKADSDDPPTPINQ